MKTVKDKKLVVGADFAGYPLKEAVVAHLKEKGWEITDLGEDNCVHTGCARAWWGCSRAFLF